MYPLLTFSRIMETSPSENMDLRSLNIEYFYMFSLPFWQTGAIGLQGQDESVNRLFEVLSARGGVQEIVDSLPGFKADLAGHIDDVSQMLTDVPEFLIRAERDRWRAALHRVNELLDEVEQGLPKGVVAPGLHLELPTLHQELLLGAVSVRYAAWAARGPSSHGGVNELLLILQCLEDGEAAEDDWKSCLVTELDRLQHQAELLEHLPEPLAGPKGELLGELQSWLEVALADSEDDARDWPDMAEELEQWGLNYSLYDVDFLMKRYSDVPTEMPVVNFALNSQRLYLDELAAAEVVDFALAHAVEAVEASSAEFLDQKGLTDLDKQTYGEAVDELLDTLEGLPEMAELEQLRQIGGEVQALVGRLLKLHQSSEGEGGSRMDYKTRGPDL
jgi:hypothetical protein